jgi:hypothetical protein
VSVLSECFERSRDGMRVLSKKILSSFKCFMSACKSGRAMYFGKCTEEICFKSMRVCDVCNTLINTLSYHVHN